MKSVHYRLNGRFLLSVCLSNSIIGRCGLLPALRDMILFASLGVGHGHCDSHRGVDSCSLIESHFVAIEVDSILAHCVGGIPTLGQQSENIGDGQILDSNCLTRGIGELIGLGARHNFGGVAVSVLGDGGRFAVECVAIDLIQDLFNGQAAAFPALNRGQVRQRGLDVRNLDLAGALHSILFLREGDDPGGGCRLGGAVLRADGNDGAVGVGVGVGVLLALHRSQGDAAQDRAQLVSGQRLAGGLRLSQGDGVGRIAVRVLSAGFVGRVEAADLVKFIPSVRTILVLDGLQRTGKSALNLLLFLLSGLGGVRLAGDLALDLSFGLLGSLGGRGRGGCRGGGAVRIGHSLGGGLAGDSLLRCAVGIGRGGNVEGAVVGDLAIIIDIRVDDHLVGGAALRLLLLLPAVLFTAGIPAFLPCVGLGSGFDILDGGVQHVGLLFFLLDRGVFVHGQDGKGGFLGAGVEGSGGEHQARDRGRNKFLHFFHVHISSFLCMNRTQRIR